MKEKKIPMRRCAGCMTSKEKQELVRIAAYEGRVSLDLTGQAKGRGVYLCKNDAKCREQAYKRRALERSLSVTMTQEEKDALFAQLAQLSGEVQP